MAERSLRRPAALVGSPSAGATRVGAARSVAPPPSVRLCFVVLGGLVLAAVLAPFVAPHDPLAQSLAVRNQPPAWMAGGGTEHLLGTDQIGYDLLSRTLYGARPALGIAFVAALVALSVGTALGLVAGYFRGVVDAVIMTAADAQLAVPFLVIAIAAVAAFGQGLPILVVLAGVSGWMGFARTVRSQVLSLQGREFVVAARTAGASNARILARHLLPNLTSIAIVLVTIQLRAMILFEASLSFLGLGVPPPQPSWGQMISAGREYLMTAWWISVVPGVALVLTVLSVSLIGDWLRDALDPTLRGAAGPAG